ncbi:MAG: extracellular solute-binding protein [Eubacterium sp.]|nr:extracellular solute-binding protein [Eubacterium sp.]
MKNLKKIMCATLASTMMLGLVACGDGDTKGSGENPSSASAGVMADNKLETAKTVSNIKIFKKNDGLDLSQIMGTFAKYMVAGDYIYFSTNDSPDVATGSDSVGYGVIGGETITEENVARLYKIPITGGTPELVYETEKGNEMGLRCVKPDGTLVFNISSTDPSLSEESYMASVKFFETNGDTPTENPGYKNAFENTYIDGFVFDKDGNLVVIYESKKIKVFDKDFNKIAECQSGGEIGYSCQDANGEVVVFEFANTPESNGVLRKLDVAAGKLDEGIECPTYITDGGIVKGTDGYDLYYTTNSAVYGYNYDGNKSTEIVDFSSSGINSDCLIGFDMISADTLLCCTRDGDYTAPNVLEKYTKADASDVEDKNVLTVASIGSDNADFKQIVLDYNESQDENMIAIVDYSQAEDPMAKFSADVSAGTVPDLYYIQQSFGDMTINQCVAKGMFEDLTPYLEKDEELSESDIIPSVYQNMLVDGKLYYTCPSVGVYSMVGNKSVIGENPGWDTTELKACVDSKPEGSEVFESYNKDNMLNAIMWGGLVDDYINWDKGECSFDSQDFKNLVEICNTGSNDEEAYLEGTGVEMVGNKEVLLASAYCLNPSNYTAYSKAVDGNLVFKGYPSKRKSAGIFQLGTAVAMSSQCADKEAAWDFVRYLFTEDCQSKMYASGSGIPTRNDVFDVYADTFTWTESGTDKYGNEIKIENVEDNSDPSYSRKPVSQDDVKAFRAFVDTCGGYYGCDRKIWDIISEEAKAYFSGDKSLDDVCSIIQDRITTYVNESK